MYQFTGKLRKSPKTLLHPQILLPPPPKSLTQLQPPTRQPPSPSQVTHHQNLPRPLPSPALQLIAPPVAARPEACDLPTLPPNHLRSLQAPAHQLRAQVPAQFTHLQNLPLPHFPMAPELHRPIALPPPDHRPVLRLRSRPSKFGWSQGLRLRRN